MTKAEAAKRNLALRETVLRLHGEGKLISEIAKTVGMPTWSVYRNLLRCGKTYFRKPLWNKLAERFTFASGCWIWTGARSENGYGILPTKPKGRSPYAHRLVYEELVGPIAPKLVIDHLCRERLCVNPGHLDPVESGENIRRGKNIRLTHCRKGHPFTTENTWVHPSNPWKRSCRICARERYYTHDGAGRQREWKRKQREKAKGSAT